MRRPRSITSPVRPVKPIIEGIVAAAGLSSRMGRPKLLLEIDGVPLLARVVRAALDSRLDRVTVVVGPSQQVPPAIEIGDQASRLSVATNPHPERGMSSSLRTGLRDINPSSAGVMILLADMPWLTTRVIDSLIESFLLNREKIVAPAVHGRRSHPVVLPRRLFGELDEITGDTGGKSLLNRHAHNVVLIEMGSYYDDSDLDTPEDLAKARERHTPSERRQR